METYEFEKCLLARLRESRDILCCKDEPIPASQVKSEWAYFIELQIEPTGWQAMWKIPRVICEELKIKFPTIVFGTVEHVMFKELKAIFTVIGVEDDDIHIPEKHEVHLEELWPTKEQENDALNVEKTADSIDRLRFFYNNIWMPWDYDYDDDVNWADKHLESRIKFYYDLKTKKVKRALAAHIYTLISEAKYIQRRKEYLELDLSDDDDSGEKTHDKTYITDLMRLHLRLTIIKSEIEMLENAEMRKIYEEINYGNNVNNLLSLSVTHNVNKEKNIYLVTRSYYINEQMNFLSKIADIIGNDKKVQLCLSLQDALNVFNSSDEIYLSVGKHEIKFLEYLNENGCITGITTASSAINDNEKAIIESIDDDNILFSFDGNFKFNNITFNCHNVRNGILIRNGNILFNNCIFIGNEKSTTIQCIAALGNSTVQMNNCCIENFATGLYLESNTIVTMNNTLIKNCFNGIELMNNSKLNLNNTKIMDNNNFGIIKEISKENNKPKEKRIIYNDLINLNGIYGLCIENNCEFINNKVGNFALCNQQYKEMNDLFDL